MGELFEGGGIIRGGNYYFSSCQREGNHRSEASLGAFFALVLTEITAKQVFSSETVYILVSWCTIGQARPNSGLEIHPTVNSGER